MNNSQFHQLADNLIFNIEEVINNISESIDIDYEIYGNVMTLIFENNSKIIINRQESIHQIWLATITNGYHFNYCDNVWICNRSKRSFNEIFNKAVKLQTKVIFDLIK
ncbi:Protein CyaY [Serratia symbiotica]|nr:Protein CyaY [Serratia symbiotica]